MDLERIWQLFINDLILNELIQKVNWKKITGIPFLYINITPSLTQQDLEKMIIKSSAAAMKGSRLHSETVFVRREDRMYVYRHRFYVPQEKMFCCGNLCVDCTRLQDRKNRLNG